MKILIVGLGCSGKSTLAREIGACTQLPVHHLDKLLWKPNWERTGRDEFLDAQRKVLSEKSWVYEGFNLESLSEQVNAADIIIYISASHITLTINWVKRLWTYRQHSRPDIAEGNIEKFNWLYLRWLWKYDNKQIIKDLRLLTKGKELIVINNNAQKRILLDTLKAK